MSPKFYLIAITYVYLHVTGGEVRATACLAPKIDPFKLNSKKVGDNIAKSNQDWKRLKIAVQLEI